MGMQSLFILRGGGNAQKAIATKWLYIEKRLVVLSLALCVQGI